MEQLNVSKFIHYLQVEDGMYIGWNRFFPSRFIMNNAAMSILDKIEKHTPFPETENVTLFLNAARKHRFIYEGDADPSQSDFIKTIREKLVELDEKVKLFYEQERDYQSLKIGTDLCNLACPYCINESAVSSTPECSKKNVEPGKKEYFLLTCSDQFFERKKKNGVTKAKVEFNGGEILLEWPLMKRLVERISEKFPGIEVEYLINTNMTLLTEEIARFFEKYRFNVSISIDGYREAHEKTRVYPNKKGSFDDVIKNVVLYRSICSTPLDIFQGTFEYADEFLPEKVQQMKQYGFRFARLAPNLLRSNEQEARKKAQIMGKFLEQDPNDEVKVTELIFTRLKNKINQDQFRFDFNCAGLYPGDNPNIEVNISTLRVSHLCGFIKEASLGFSELNDDIYNPGLWEVSDRFIRERMETVINECSECPLVGFCAGGCILTGIDVNNRINKAACAYQQEMSEIYIKKAYFDRKKKRG